MEAEPVAALARDHVDVRPPGLRLRGVAARIDDDLLHGHRVEPPTPHLSAAVAVEVVGVHPVVVDFAVIAAPAVDAHACVVLAERAADIVAPRSRRRGAKGQRGQLREIPRARGQRLEHIQLQHLLRVHVLGVDHRARPGDGHRLLDASDLHLGVHGGRKADRELDAFALEAGESRQSECDCVDARPQIHDIEAALVVSDRRADFFDQRRAGCLDGDPRHDGPACISHDPGDTSRRLRPCSLRNDQQCQGERRNT